MTEPDATGRSVVLCAIPGHHDHDYRDCTDLTTVTSLGQPRRSEAYLRNGTVER